MSRRRTQWIQAGWIILALASLPASAQQPASREPAPAPEGDSRDSVQVTDEARATLGRMTAFLRDLERFEVQMHGSRDEVLPFGYKLQNNETARMVVQRPNRLRVDVAGDIRHRSYYYDGTTLTMVAPDEGVYARTPAPGTIAELVNGLLNAGAELPLIDVLRQGLQGTLLEGVRFGLRVGETRIEDVVTDHLAFRQPTVDWQMWVAKSGQPRKLLITTRYEVGDPQYQATMKWNLKPTINASTFAFKPAQGMREISFHTGPEAGGSAGATP